MACEGENSFRCASCDRCRIIPDPDPFDWFCDDDEAVYCTEVKDYIARGLRPYEVDKVSVKVSRCPLMTKKMREEKKEE